METNRNIRFGREFGYGDVHSFSGPHLSEMTPRERIFAMGWSHACPVINRVITKHGKEYTMKRYTECNWVFQEQILKRAQNLNPDLYRQLTTPVPRLKGELPSPNISRKLVPPSFETEMSPLSTPWGYALPRIVLVGARDKHDKSSVEKVVQVKEILNEEIPKAKDPIGLTLAIGERLMKLNDSEFDVSGLKMISHLMSTGILKEEGCKTMYREILARMETEAPRLCHEYWDSFKVMNDIISWKDLE